MPIYTKQTIARPPLGRYVSRLRPDSIFLAIGSIVRWNYVELYFFEGKFRRSGRSKLPTWWYFAFMRAHSLHQYLIPAYTWYEVAHWWKVSRGCFKCWWFGKYLNVSWRSTPDFAGCWFETPILILNNNQPRLPHQKGINQRPLIYPSDVCAHGISFVPVWKVIKANWCENYMILSQISGVVDLHEESGPVTQQIITKSITLSQSRLRIYI